MICELLIFTDKNSQSFIYCGFIINLKMQYKLSKSLTIHGTNGFFFFLTLWEDEKITFIIQSIISHMLISQAP